MDNEKARDLRICIYFDLAIYDFVIYPFGFAVRGSLIVNSTCDDDVALGRTQCTTLGGPKTMQRAPWSHDTHVLLCTRARPGFSCYIPR